MVKVSVEARSGTARFAVAVRAGSLRRAASLAEGMRPGYPAGHPERSNVVRGAFAVRTTGVESPAGVAA